MPMRWKSSLAASQSIKISAHATANKQQPTSNNQQQQATTEGQQQPWPGQQRPHITGQECRRFVLPTRWLVSDPAPINCNQYSRSRSDGPAAACYTPDMLMGYIDYKVRPVRGIMRIGGLFEGHLRDSAWAV